VPPVPSPIRRSANPDPGRVPAWFSTDLIFLIALLMETRRKHLSLKKRYNSDVFTNICFEYSSIHREHTLKTNLEVIQGIYKGDAEQIAKNLQAALAPRFDWTEAAGFPYAGTFHTLEEVGKNVFARLSTEWIDYRAETESFFDAGDTVIVTGYYKGTYRQSGGIMDARFAHIWTFKDGRIVKYIQNVDTKKVWDAIGGAK
jgi:uncharacterized protein